MGDAKSTEGKAKVCIIKNCRGALLTSAKRMSVYVGVCKLYCVWKYVVCGRDIVCDFWV